MVRLNSYKLGGRAIALTLTLKTKNKILLQVRIVANLDLQPSREINQKGKGLQWNTFNCNLDVN